MYEPPKSFFTRLIEGAVLFALSAWLLRMGICMLGEIWVPLVILAVLGIASVIGFRLWKHYRDTHF